MESMGRVAADLVEVCKVTAAMLMLNKQGQANRQVQQAIMMD